MPYTLCRASSGYVTVHPDQPSAPVLFDDPAPGEARVRAAEETASRAHREREDLIASIDGIVWEADVRTFSFTFVSAQAERILGYPIERWLGDPDFWRDHIHPDDRDQAVSYCLASTRERRDHRFEYRMLAADGRIVWLHDAVTVISEGNEPVTLRGVMVDITERKEAERIQERTRMLLSSIVEHSPATVSVKEAAELRYVLFNRAGERLTGRSRDEVIGRTDFELVERRQAEQFLAEDRNVLETGRVMEVSHQLASAPGGVRYLRTAKVPIFGADGRPEYILGVSEDITERHRLEEQLRQAQKMEALGQLAGGVAHDFNNLLTIIGGYSDLLLQRLPSGEPMRHEIEEIRNAGERAALLTGQLLAFSRKQVLQPRIFDLATVVEESERVLSRVLGEDVSMEARRGPGSTVVRVDPGPIWQVLLNLALNARDAMPDGGSLTFETAAVVLDDAAAASRRTLKPGPYVLLTVTDTGCGIPPDDHPHVFEPFFTTKPVGQGTGLGLAVVHGIITQSGGHIEFDSNADGTRFRIYLPAAPNDARAGDVGSRPGEPLQTGRETILLVEDEEAVRRLSAKVLERAGYRVLSAADGAEAIRAADVHDGDIDLLVTDVVMPGMSGTQLAAAFRTRNPEIRVLFVSGYTPDAVLRHGVREGELAFLQKPFSPAALASRVREVLDATSPPS
jgi:two-component system cell cycle sensor histidine kinase/response regulator CckA